MSGRDDNDDSQDPALKNFNRTAFQAQHVVKETATGGLVGAATGAAVMGAGAAAMVIIPCLSLGPVSIAACAGAALLGGGSIVAPAVIAAATTGALWGGGIGAAIKGALGLGGAGEAADAEAEKVVITDQQMRDRMARKVAMEQRRDEMSMASGQSQAMRGRNPNQSLPRGGATDGREVYS